MALHAIATRYGRRGISTDPAPVESFFQHLKTDWPRLLQITDPAALAVELDAIQHEYNTVRLQRQHRLRHPRGRALRRGEGIRTPRRRGLARARRRRIEYHRGQKN